MPSTSWLRSLLPCSGSHCRCKRRRRSLDRFVEVSAVDECSGSPIRAATVRLVYELDSNQKPVPQTVWQRTIAAGQDGYFELKDYGPAGGAQSVGLEISSDGYETVYIVYRDRPQQQHVFCASLRAVRGVTTTYN